MRASGMAAIHGIFERTARDKFVRKKIAAIIPTPAPTMILVLRDLIKTSVSPTSWYHHQSVIKETMLEKKIKAITTIPKNAQEKNLLNFIKPTNLVLAGYN